MRYIKLFGISVVVFGVMLFCISLLFPSNTIVSRAVNISKRNTDKTFLLHQLHNTAFRYDADMEILEKLDSDTFLTPSGFASHIQQGVALYDLPNDSTAVQVFYKIHVPTYRFWDKFGLMLNEAKYGPSLDSATMWIAEKFSGQK